MYSGFQITYLIALLLVASFSIFLCIKKGGGKQEFLCFYLGASFILEFLMLIFQIYFGSSAKFGFLYNIYILLCPLFFLFYFNRNQDTFLVKVNTLIFMVFAVIFLSFIFNNYQEVNQTIGISFSLVYILYGLIWFYGKIRYPNEKKMMNDPKFWISCGLLLWGVFFILRIIPRYLFNEVDGEVLIVSQSFFFVINILFYISFFISLLKYNKQYD
jgi:hypothetical protein